MSDSSLITLYIHLFILKIMLVILLYEALESVEYCYKTNSPPTPPKKKKKIPTRAIPYIVCKGEIWNVYYEV